MLEPIIRKNLMYKIFYFAQTDVEKCYNLFPSCIFALKRRTTLHNYYQYMRQSVNRSQLILTLAKIVTAISLARPSCDVIFAVKNLLAATAPELSRALTPEVKGGAWCSSCRRMRECCVARRSVSMPTILIPSEVGSVTAVTVYGRHWPGDGSV